MGSALVKAQMKKQSSINREIFVLFPLQPHPLHTVDSKLATNATHANNLQTENTHCPCNLQIETTILIKSHTLPKLHKNPNPISHYKIIHRRTQKVIRQFYESLTE